MRKYNISNYLNTNYLFVKFIVGLIAVKNGWVGGSTGSTAAL